MGEALMMRRLGARITEGKYAWKKSGEILVKTAVTYGGTGTTKVGVKPNCYVSVESNYNVSYFTEKTFHNAKLTNAEYLDATLLPNGVCEYKRPDKEELWSDGTWSYDAEKGELTAHCWRFSFPSGTTLTLSGSGEAYQPDFGFIGYVVDDDSAKYPDNGTQGEYTYEKIY